MRLAQAVVVHPDRLEGIVDPAAYLIGGYAEIFGSERHIVLDDSRDYLVIGILEHHADLAADVGEPVLIRSVDAVNGNCAALGH